MASDGAMLGRDQPRREVPIHRQHWQQHRLTVLDRSRRNPNPARQYAGHGKLAFDARLAPDGATLWVVDDGSNSVTGFTVSGGNLTELASSPTSLPARAAPFGIVVT
jgi:hypothetical protein